MSRRHSNRLRGGSQIASAVSLSTLVGLAACAGPSEHRVAPAEAHALVAAGATLLDVRTEDEWLAGHLTGARHVPVAELDARLGELPRDRPVVVYCASGVRSARAADLLAAAGYEVHDLGGMSAW